MPASSNKPAELVAGYSLQERIGSGGYGEVWRAEAPGGLLKAVKFIYGQFEEQRASCELRALHRIKEVRHPFLLSLERIEVIDGQLIIVTELADTSLCERYENFRSEGLAGIPREELLLYLHDAADALDYMCEQFQLQHLDIKPENLLIVGGRVKVADFGLVKGIEDVTVSLMTGMTPVYAAPEVFDAHPSLHSDQYSLAIVYQEMLTGQLPFTGKTPAQLTNQHLNGNPRLSPLPASDRQIIARALSKDHTKRFANCRALIEALQKASVEAIAVQAVPPAPVANQGVEAVGDTKEPLSHNDVTQGSPPAESAFSPVEKTVVADGSSFVSESGVGSSSVHGSRVEAAVASREKIDSVPLSPLNREDLKPLEPPPPSFDQLPCWNEPFATAAIRPTLVIGAGGTAAMVLKKLQHRWQDRFDDLDQMPIFESVLFDTDSRTLDLLASASDPTACFIQSDRLPLRKAEEYREHADKLGHWLGHRWIYNIPRSLRTEGLRPLGRLALVDNAERVIARLRKNLKRITSSEAKETASARKDISVSESGPLVYLVASISGGTGSGMILDLAFAVRRALALEGIVDAKICGILLHGTSRHSAEKSLAIANSYACLRELHAYERKYPGEAVWELPASPNGVSPFDDTYFLHLGDDLGDAQFSDSTEMIAEYIDLDAATACRSFFENCRSSPMSRESSRVMGWTLRNMGLSRMGFTPEDISTADIDRLCLGLAEHWRQTSMEMVPAATTAGERKGNSEKSLLDLIEVSVEVEEKVNLRIYTPDVRDFEDSSHDALPLAIEGSHPKPTEQQTKRNLERLFASVRSIMEKSLVSSAPIDKAAFPELAELAASKGLELQEQLLKEIATAENGLPRLQKAIDLLLAELHRREHEDGELLERLRKLMNHSGTVLLPPEAVESKSWFHRMLDFGKSRQDPHWKDHSRWQLELVMLHSLCYMWHSLHASIAAFNEQLREFRQGMLALVEEFQQAESSPKSSAEQKRSVHSLMSKTWSELLRKNQRDFILKLEQRLRQLILNEFLGGGGNAVPKKTSPKAKADLLREGVQKEVADLLREIDLAGMVFSTEESSANKSPLLNLILKEAEPSHHADYGGAQRLLLACPANAALDSIREKIKNVSRIEPSVAITSNPEIILCHEVERVPPLRIAAQLLQEHAECRELAFKLQARIDIAWPRGF